MANQIPPADGASVLCPRPANGCDWKCRRAMSALRRRRTSPAGRSISLAAERFIGTSRGWSRDPETRSASRWGTSCGLWWRARSFSISDERSMKINLTRRDFIRTGLAAAAGVGLSRYAFADAPTSAPAKAAAQLVAKADAMIHIWLPGGMAQTDTWDPQKYTPYRAGMKGSELLGTCEPIPTSADGILLGKGLDNIASVMNRGTILRTLSSETKFGAVHLKAQYYAMTGYLFPSGVKTPSLGAAVARTLGRRNPQVPPYIYIGRDIDTSDEEKLFISEYIGPGFYGVNYAPFMIPDPAKGLSTLNAVSGMKMDRLDRRQEYLRAITGLAEPELQQANKAKDYMKVMEDARAMMDSPVKRAFDFLKDEKPETVKAYEPEIGASDLLDKTYYYGYRFGQGLLLAPISGSY